ncbi:hypothetical protein AMK16_22620 [Streptomyces sp. CB00455]|uniref:hypothetical protein n=1 Tax=Streptomyces sp. CB00455 TaxID=1703927 RepID=UPI00093CC030|nr:hypothetical protein [Streptomyces sp. CB00455]OKK17588.1 hypothetical protein AMK16_22620 [Streptomyces sp. CB00455]
MTDTEIIEYRIEHLRDRLAQEELAELGVRIELRGARVVIWGSVPDPECRSVLERLAGEELADVPWQIDLTVSHANPPDHCEELS